MSIINIYPAQIGESGQRPSVIYIDTNNTSDEVQEVGFLNNYINSFGIRLSEYNMALVSTKETPNSRSVQVSWFQISFSNGQWSLLLSEISFPVAVNQGGTGSTTASGARTNLGLGSAATQNSNFFAQVGNNLSDLADIPTARTNLGLGSAALRDDNFFLQAGNNLSDVNNAATARTNLGLGTAATQNSTFFSQVANNLSDLTSASTARTNLGLTGAATMALPVAPANGGTGVASPTAHALPISEGSGNFNFITLTNNQILVGSTGNDPVPMTLSTGFKVSGSTVITSGFAAQLSVPVGGTTTVMNAAGNTLVILASADCVVTIDTATLPVDSVVSILCDTSNNALSTIQMSSGNIGGQASIVLGAGDNVNITWNGSYTSILYVYLQPCNMRYYLNGTQTIPGVSTRVVEFDTPVWDDGGFFVGTPDFYWQPKLPGKFRITATCFWDITLGAPGTPKLVGSLTLNGGTSDQEVNSYNSYGTAVTSVQSSVTATGDFSLNGSTDNVGYFITNFQASDLIIGGGTPGDVVICGSRFSLF